MSRICLSALFAALFITAAPVLAASDQEQVRTDDRPRVMILSTGNPRLLDLPGSMRHKASGFTCPERFDGLPVLLKTLDPRRDYFACAYRAGTELRFRAGDPVRYQLTLARALPGQTLRQVFDKLAGAARASLRVTGDHAPPRVGRPAPDLVAFWDTENAGVHGLWVGKAGDWVVWLRAQYAPSADNDAEAGKVAQALFAAVAAQVR